MTKNRTETVLIVDGDPIHWYGISASGKPRRNTIRIDGDLPTVPETRDDGLIHAVDGDPKERPLSVGDRVTLATMWASKTPVGPLSNPPFATATVALINGHDWEQGTYFITVTDVVALS